MKYLVVVLVVAVVLWLLLRGKAEKPVERSPGGKSAAKVMVQCAHCSVHLPRSDALLDHRGAFCSAAHQLAGPKAR